MPIRRFALMDEAGDDGGAGGGAGGGTGGDGGAGGGGFDPASIAEIPVTQLLGEEHELARHPALKDFKNVDGLARSLIDTQKMVGMDKNKLLALPPEGATDEELSAFYDKLGRPSDPKEYEADEFTPPEQLKDFQPNKELMDQFREIAHKEGLTPKQFKALTNFYNGFSAATMVTALEAQEQARATTEKTLKQEWGTAYDKELGLAHKAVAEYTDDEFRSWLDQTGLGNDIRMLRTFAKIGATLQEGTDVGGGGGGGGNNGAMTPAQAQQVIASKYSDESFMKAYSDAGHPNHGNAVSEMERLFQMAHPPATD